MLSLPALDRVAGVERSEPPDATTWGLAARSSQLDPSHPSLAFRKVMINADGPQQRLQGWLVGHSVIFSHSH